MSGKPRILILNTDYPEYLDWLYVRHPGLEEQPYDEQMGLRSESMFSVADFYSSNLRRLGHEAWDIHVNNEFMQKAWAKEQGVRVREPTPGSQLTRIALRRARRIAAKTPLHRLIPLLRPLVSYLSSPAPWFYDILAAQIKHYKPDVLLNQAMDGISSRFLREMRPHLRLLVGQIASPLPRDEDFSCYDLIISSLPIFVEHFRSLGARSELHRLGFESAVLLRLKGRDPEIPVSFVGSLSSAHRTRVSLLDYLCSHLDIRIWGSGLDRLPKGSPIRSHYKGSAWGTEMYQILHTSKMTLNHHIDIAGSFANNMRLFEATGVGTLLITDWKENLHELFEPDKEVIAYRDPEECAELIQYYLEHENEREAIARAGQQRTLREHTYYHRMQELEDIILRHLHISAARLGGKI